MVLADEFARFVARDLHYSARANDSTLTSKTWVVVWTVAWWRNWRSWRWRRLRCTCSWGIFVHKLSQEQFNDRWNKSLYLQVLKQLYNADNFQPIYEPPSPPATELPVVKMVQCMCERGPAGPPGLPGEDGKDGKDGKPGKVLIIVFVFDGKRTSYFKRHCLVWWFLAEIYNFFFFFFWRMVGLEKKVLLSHHKSNRWNLV